MEQQIQLNDHNKQEYPPMHTAEHLLNATIGRTYTFSLKEKRANVIIFFCRVRQQNKFSLLKIK